MQTKIYKSYEDFLKRENKKENGVSEDGFLTQEEASEYVRKRKELWGSNLVGWVEEKDGKFFPCFNLWD